MLRKLFLEADMRVLLRWPVRFIVGFFIFLSAIMLVVESQFAVLAADPVLTYIEQQMQGVNSVQGIDTVYQVTVSGDGKNLYAAGFGSNSLAVFRRNTTTGSLTYQEVLTDGVSGIDGLQGVASVTVSKDGSHVYATSLGDNALTVFSRDSTHGTLSFIQILRDSVAGVDGLNDPTAVIVSPYGRNIYVVSRLDNSVAGFGRDTTTGQLTFLQIVKDGTEGVDGLAGADDLVISPDGGHIYVIGKSDNAVAAFSRDTQSGLITFVQEIKDSDIGVDGLATPSGIAISPNGTHVYVSSNADNAVAVFARHGTTGVLTFIEVIKDTDLGVDGLQFAEDVAVSPDGQRVFVAAYTDNAVSVFSRDERSGKLTYVEIQKQGVNGVTGLTRPASLGVTSNGGHLYVTSAVDNTIVAFRVGTSLPQDSGVCPTQEITSESQIIPVDPLGGSVYSVQPNTDRLLTLDDGLVLRIRNPSWHSTYQIRFRTWSDPPTTGADTLLRATRIEAFDPSGNEMSTFLLCNALQLRVSLDESEKDTLGGYYEMFEDVQTGSITLATPDVAGEGKLWVPILTRFDLDSAAVFTEITTIPVTLGLLVSDVPVFPSTSSGTNQASSKSTRAAQGTLDDPVIPWKTGFHWRVRRLGNVGSSMYGRLSLGESH